MINKYELFLELYIGRKHKMSPVKFSWIKNIKEEEVEPKKELPKPVEVEKPEPDIKPLVYDSDNKCMTGVYKLISRDENTTTISNIQEIEAHGYMLPRSKGGREKLFYLDGKQSGYSIRRVVDLPTKKIHLLKELEDGYCELSIPYFIYKPEMKKLKILKLNKNLYRIADMTSRIKDLEQYI